ncbi:MAG: class I SAM-dependent methyltransferase [Desulfomonile sp.]|nr:class I SAM-dependent methyltransferase [Desulfomonile sp.]
MAIPDEYSFVRYLSSKKSVDDRALNEHVRRRLVDSLKERGDRRLEVLEFGAGIGTMIERFLSWEAVDRLAYTALDLEADLVAEAERRAAQWARDAGFSVEQSTAGQIRITRGDRDAVLEFNQSDLFNFLERTSGRGRWDLLIANAFLDLVDLPTVVPQLGALLAAEGLCYFTINFDGATIFQPDIDPELDRHIEALYHETMDTRVIAGRPSGESRTGRHLFGALRAAGMELLAAGPSDWVVFAGPEGYPEDETYFLHHIVDTVRGALENNPKLDSSRFRDWIDRRHEQIEQGSLVFIAHQLDFLARRMAKHTFSQVR